MTFFLRTASAFAIAGLAAFAGASALPTAAVAHGDVTPQAVDVTGLEPLGDEWVEENPYRGDAKAIEIGSSAYNQNCARCHGLEVISGGVAPDLRYLPQGLEGDEWYVMRVRNGVVRNGMTYMPAFEETLSQEALWAIRAYIEEKYTEE
ncbi:Cytochrome C550 (Soluble cytochrome C) [Caenispirillum salinarum AK4]|uniref:Cytochrome C550 (Soluble cytochrome C) n=1 Tax=Caenispirillum salinarum AK4 TaxID=1238182 RepID=K9GU34_9PROT|nr:cytochrome c-550 PedF [Caenispirillum salinarum]EKV28647.1 Cytochrome C550 (Soluble cytochrome C) [Caenispirillum salinarum AK4]